MPNKEPNFVRRARFVCCLCRCCVWTLPTCLRSTLACPTRAYYIFRHEIPINIKFPSQSAATAAPAAQPRPSHQPRPAAIDPPAQQPPDHFSSYPSQPPNASDAYLVLHASLYGIPPFCTRFAPHRPRGCRRRRVPVDRRPDIHRHPCMSPSSPTRSENVAHSSLPPFQTLEDGYVGRPPRYPQTPYALRFVPGTLLANWARALKKTTDWPHSVRSIRQKLKDMSVIITNPPQDSPYLDEEDAAEALMDQEACQRPISPRKQLSERDKDKLRRSVSHSPRYLPLNYLFTLLPGLPPVSTTPAIASSPQSFIPIRGPAPSLLHFPVLLRAPSSTVDAVLAHPLSCTRAPMAGPQRKLPASPANHPHRSDP